MKILILVYSKTGNTVSVIERLLPLLEKKHKVTLLRVSEAGDGTIVENIPADISVFDHVLVATPVQGFMPSAAILSALNLITSFADKHVDILLTQYFRWAALGGNQSIKRLKTIINEKHGHVRHATIVNWSSRKREQQIVAALELLGNL